MPRAIKKNGLETILKVITITYTTDEVQKQEFAYFVYQFMHYISINLQLFPYHAWSMYIVLLSNMNCIQTLAEEEKKKTTTKKKPEYINSKSLCL
jgi:hypothetical protein